MPIPILMPALSPTMTEGTLAVWLKKEGDLVRAGEAIAEIETDKATMEVEAAEEGTLATILVSAGSEGVAVNTPIAMLLEDGEDISIATPRPVSGDPKNIGMHEKTDLQEKRAAKRIFATPLARHLAGEADIELESISGSGPSGRIVKADIERAVREGLSPPGAVQATASLPSPEMPPTRVMPPESGREVTLSSMRKAIARRLTEAKQQVPHFYLSLDCELDALLDLRHKLNARDGADYKLSVNDLVIKAAALATVAFPSVNARWGGDHILELADVDVAVAVSVDGGLITPIVTGADNKSVVAISNEMKELARRAREGNLQPHEYEGGGLTISNLGMYGIKTFQAVINPPQACILAVGAGEQRPAVRNGALAVATIMSVTLSVDHRVIDGALAAEWLQSFKRQIEDPLGMLL